MPRHSARHDPDRKTGRDDRPCLGWPVSVRGGRRVEPGRDRGSPHRLQNPLQEDARADRSDEGDLDQIRTRNITAILLISRRCGPGRSRCRSRTRRSSSAVRSRTAPGARSAMATGGYQTRAGPTMPTSRSFCRSFDRWRLRPAVRRLRFRSRSGAHRTTSIASSAIAIRESHVSSEPSLGTIG